MVDEAVANFINPGAILELFEDFTSIQVHLLRSTMSKHCMEEQKIHTLWKILVNTTLSSWGPLVNMKLIFLVVLEIVEKAYEYFFLLSSALPCVI